MRAALGFVGLAALGQATAETVTQGLDLLETRACASSARAGMPGTITSRPRPRGRSWPLAKAASCQACRPPSWLCRAPSGGLPARAISAAEARQQESLARLLDHDGSSGRRFAVRSAERLCADLRTFGVHLFQYVEGRKRNSWATSGGLCRIQHTLIGKGLSKCRFLHVYTPSQGFAPSTETAANHRVSARFRFSVIIGQNRFQDCRLRPLGNRPCCLLLPTRLSRNASWAISVKSCPAPSCWTVWRLAPWRLFPWPIP